MLSGQVCSVIAATERVLYFDTNEVVGIVRMHSAKSLSQSRNVSSARNEHHKHVIVSLIRVHTAVSAAPSISCDVGRGQHLVMEPGHFRNGEVGVKVSREVRVRHEANRQLVCSTRIWSA